MSGLLLPRLPLSGQKKSPTFPDEIADNMWNKRTFIDKKSASCEVLVVFQQLMKVNSTRRTSDMQKRIKVRIKYR